MEIPVQSLDLFPTRIWQFDLSHLASYFPAWQQSLEDWRAQEPTAAGRSNRSGWNSDKTLFGKPEFAPLLEAAQTAFIHALRESQPGRNLSFALEAWANIHDPGGYNMMHLHQGVLLSGCFYLTMPEGAGALVFQDPRPGVVLSTFKGPGVNSNQFVQVKPRPGLLLLFPNWLEHAVETNEASTQRHAIAMNALQVVG